jgi:hypothetical protein
MPREHDVALTGLAGSPANIASPLRSDRAAIYGDPALYQSGSVSCAGFGSHAALVRCRY